MIFHIRQVSPVLFARTFLFFGGRIPKYGFGHEADGQKCFGRENTGEFGVSAIRIQCTTPRTRIRPKFKKKIKLNFAYPSNPGYHYLLIGALSK